MALRRDRVLLPCPIRGVHDGDREADPSSEQQDNGGCLQPIGTAAHHQSRGGPRAPREHREQQEEPYEGHDTTEAQHNIGR
jgi:hypothetical protein